MPRPRDDVRRLLILLALAAVACGGSDNAPTAPSPVIVSGAWQLRNVNGASLPYAATQPNGKTELLSDQFTLNADGTWVEVASYRITEGTTVTTTTATATGVYTSTTNGALQFTQMSPYSATFTGAVVNETLRLYLGSLTWAYGR